MKAKLLLIALLASLALVGAQQAQPPEQPQQQDQPKMRGFRIGKGTADAIKASRAARGQSRDGKSSVIIIRGEEFYTATYSYPSFPCDGTGAGYSGIWVVNGSWSSNAPPFELPFIHWNPCGIEPWPYVEIGQVLADRLAEGYDIIHISDDGLTYTLARTPGK